MLRQPMTFRKHNVNSLKYLFEEKENYFKSGKKERKKEMERDSSFRVSCLLRLVRWIIFRSTLLLYFGRAGHKLRINQCNL